MTCDRYRELISAGLDAELDRPERVDLEHHLSSCGACVAYEDQAHALRRSTRLDVADELVAPPHADEPVAMAYMTGDLRWHSGLRYALFVIGGTLIVLNLGNLLGTGSLEDHASRHDGVFGTALGIGMVTVAARPRRAIGLVPLTSAVAVLMAIVAIGDLVGDRASMMAEAVHLLEFGGLICLWVISGGVARAQVRTSTLLAWSRRPSVPSWPTR